LTLAVPNIAQAQLVCNKFAIKHSIAATNLTVSLDTDLPDSTEIMVDVSRSYFEKGNPEEYPLSYVEEKSTVGAWRSAHQIDVSDPAWKLKLQERQKTTAAAGLGFVLGRVLSSDRGN